MKYTFKGCKKVAGMSKNLRGFYDPNYLQLFHDTITHECWAVHHYSLGHQQFTQYDDENIWCVGFITEPVTMEQVNEMIHNYFDKQELATSIL